MTPAAPAPDPGGAPAGRRIGVTGTAVEDTIERPGAPVVEDMGGIYYAVAALRALSPGPVVPVLAVGSDAADRVRDDFERMGVETGGVLPVDATNNKVRIVYRSAGDRDETLTGGVPPLEWPALEPWIGKLDAWLWNFVAGNETDRATFGRVKAAFAGPVHLDVHSLCLGPPGAGPRRPRPPEGWEAWVEGARWVQCNEREAGLMWAAEDAALDPAAEAALAERVRSLGAEGLLVTRGPAGATWHGAGGRIDAPADPAGDPVDPTGCGDVTGAAWVALRFGRGLAPGAALRGAMTAAGRAATGSGTRGLVDALSSPAIEPPPNGGER